MNLEKKQVNEQTFFNLLTLEEASELLGLKVSQLRAMVFKRQVPVIRLGARVRFHKHDLKVWLDQKRKESEKSMCN